MSSITLFGAGSWGTALAVHLARAGRDVTLWARRAEAVAQMRRTHTNPTYLSDVQIPESVAITSNLDRAAEASDFWALVTPSQHIRSMAEALRPHVYRDGIVVSLAKGIENESLLTMTQVLAEVLGDYEGLRFGTLHGPSHAEEVAARRPTTVVAAADQLDVAEQIRERFMTETLRVYANTDVVGVEIGGAAKNVLAIAAGISDGLGYGDNAWAALTTRGIAEIRRLGLAMGARTQTFAGLSGIGDLMVTCMSEHSRNRYVGVEIGKGRSLDAVVDEMNMVAEGVRTTASIHALAQRHDLEMPITEVVYRVLFDDKRPETMVSRLMTRSAKQEDWLPDDLRGEAPEN
ncbi:MAG: glycerol-3-phosphate dehydrogenase [Bacteroidetes bacterium SW_9_63_38]|nr:MAG: glycerol-3-phosphate dehydrogenase [Bacteroidetes bacterium SW_9_63_38]